MNQLIPYNMLVTIANVRYPIQTWVYYITCYICVCVNMIGGQKIRSSYHII